MHWKLRNSFAIKKIYSKELKKANFLEENATSEDSPQVGLQRFTTNTKCVVKLL